MSPLLLLLTILLVHVLGYRKVYEASFKGHPVPEPNPGSIPTTNCFPWNNVALDGGISAPENHIVLIENDWVRVVEVNNPGHSKENYHTHARPSLFMEDRPASVQHWYADGTANPIEPETPQHIYQAPMTVAKGAVYCMAPNDFHSVYNADTKLFHAIRMEMKGFSPTDPLSPGYLPCPSEACTSTIGMHEYKKDWLEKTADVCATPSSSKLTNLTRTSAGSGVELVLENSAIRVWDVSVAPGDLSPAVQLQNRAVVVVDKLAGYQLFDSRTGVVVRSTPNKVMDEDDYYAKANLVTGKVFMLEPSSVGAWQISNTDNKQFHAIFAELLNSSYSAP